MRGVTGTFGLIFISQLKGEHAPYRTRKKWFSVIAVSIIFNALNYDKQCKGQILYLILVSKWL